MDCDYLSTQFLNLILKDISIIKVSVKHLSESNLQHSIFVS